MIIDLPDATATDALGHEFARALYAWDEGLVVTLAGPLGAGKTAFVRAILSGLGENGPVVSPSYTLVEPYSLADRTIYHADLYRLADPSELDFLGLRDINLERDWLFVEWAEQGGNELPPTDISISLDYGAKGRTMRLTAQTTRGSNIQMKLNTSGTPE